VKTIIGEILPLALVVTLSPINIIPSILLLFGRRPLLGASAFLAGFAAGVSAVLAGLVVLSGAIDFAPSSGHESWAKVLKLVLGLYLVGAAVKKFRSRPRAGEEGSMPGWMDGIASSPPSRSFGIGALLGALNPKNLVVGLAAAIVVSSSQLPGTQQMAACAVYVVVAALGVAAPIGAMLVLGERAGEVLESWKVWLRQNNPAVMSVLFLVFGVILISQAISGS
jgi:threonine/homoserine/homoserine lactone efflux protein